MTASFVGLILALAFVVFMVAGLFDKDFSNSVECRGIMLLLAALLCGLYTASSFFPEASTITYVCAGLWGLNALLQYMGLVAHCR